MANITATMNTHGSLSIQQVAHIKKDILVSLNNVKETFWDKFFSHEQLPAGVSSMEYRKLILNDLTAQDIKNLNEGVTPDPKQLHYAKFQVTPVDFGNWMAYTDASVRYNFDDVVRDAKADLSLDAFQQVENRKAATLLATKFSITAEATLMATATKAKVIMRKNHVKPLHGNAYGWIVTPEIENEILTNYYKDLVQTSALSLVNGYIGKLFGFEIFSNAFYGLYNGAKQYSIFVGKANGKLGAKTIAFGNDSVQVYDNGLGSIPQVDTDSDGSITSVKPDALHQRGSVGYKVQGFATAIEFDECYIKCEHTATAINQTITEANRTNFVAQN